jgi:hypothetical protein
MRDREQPPEPEKTQEIPALPEEQSRPAADNGLTDAPGYALERASEEVEAEPIRQPAPETPRQTWASPPEEYSVASPVSRGSEVVLDNVDQEGTGMTVGDGFRFGCGFVLAMAIGTLALLIVLTIFFAVGTLVGFKLPF